MEIKRNRVARHRRNSFVPSSSKSVRAEDVFWAQIDEVAVRQKTSRNELIVRVMSRYCARSLKRNGKS
jgi:predicted DNA-binding ribbon-helix-helix protein